MKNLLWLRIVVDLVLALCVIFGWWYAALPLGVIAAWAFPRYAELVLAGFFYDLLFGMNAAAGLWGYAGIIISIIASGLVYFVKRSVRRP